MRLKYPKPSSWIDNLWFCVAIICVIAFASMYIDRANRYYKGKALDELPKHEREEYNRIRDERLATDAPTPKEHTDEPPPFAPHRRAITATADNTNEARKALAERLSDGPKRIDWTKYSLEELKQLEVKKSIAEELAQRGTLIDWETAPIGRLERALRQPPP